jgi:hypothetical protein
MRSRLSHTAKGNQKLKASHPSALAAKVEIRRNVMAMLQEKHVFDAFAGDGTLYERVWQEADSYVGCDLKWYRDERACYVADNRRIMRAIDLQQFTIFDFDAHGAPWEQVYILAHRRVVDVGERIGVILTEGTGLKLKMGGMPWGLVHMTGVQPGVAGVIRQQEDLQHRAIRRLEQMMEAKVVKRWQAESRSATRVFYIGLVLEGVANGHQADSGPPGISVASPSAAPQRTAAPASRASSRKARARPPGIAGDAKASPSDARRRRGKPPPDPG